MDWRACVDEATRLRQELNRTCAPTVVCKDDLRAKIAEANRLVARIDPLKRALVVRETALGRLQLSEVTKAEMRLVMALRLATRTVHAEALVNAGGDR